MIGRIFACILITAVLSTASYAAKRGLPDQVIPECFGVNIHFTGDNDKEVKQIADAGFKFIRMDFSWSWIEKEKGKYDFSAYDGLMTALDRHGIRPLFILDYGNPLYDSDMAPYTTEGRKAFAAFAKAAASHFKDRGILWEIWNEPNGSGFWRPKPNPEHYALLAVETAKALKEADKTATILGPALAGMDFGYLEKAFEKGLLQHIDVASVHPYRSQFPETVAGEYEQLRALIDRFAPKGKQIPIVSGEWGYSAVDMSVEQQAQYLVRQFLTNLMCGVKLSIWYDWHDDGDDPKEREHHFGTVYRDFSPKPAYKAVQTLSRELKGCRCVSRLYTENLQDYVLLFKDSGGGYKIAAWTTDEPHTISLPLDVPSATLTDQLGNRSRQKVMSETLKIELGPAVTYIGNLDGSKRLAIEESLKIEPTPVKQPNTSVLPATVQFTNPLNDPIKVMIILKDLQNGRVLDSSPMDVGAGKTAKKPVKFQGAWDGSSTLGSKMEMVIEGFEEPFCRLLSFDTSKRFTVTAAPPAGNIVVLTISNPSGEPFNGYVMLSSGPGMTVGAATVPFKLEKGQTIEYIKYPVLLGDRKFYSYRFMVLDSRNEVVYSVEDRTFRLVNSFEKPEEMKVEMDGDSKVSGTLEAAASDLPERLAGSTTCTRLTYNYGSGWKFARLVPKSEIPINGKPKELGVWIYGDKSGNYVRARFTDSTGQTFQPHLATIDWEGWRFVTCRIEGQKMGFWAGANDGIIHWPLKWDTLLLLDSAGGREQSGEIYAGPMWLIY